MDYDYINVGTTVGRGQKCGDAINFDSYHSMPDIPEILHEDTVSTAYSLLVNIRTVIHMGPAIALFFNGSTTPPNGSGPIIVEASRSHPRTLRSTPLDERSDRSRDLYLTTHSTQNRNPCPREGFEPATPTSERLQN
jgi:hypothetical protein